MNSPILKLCLSMLVIFLGSCQSTPPEHEPPPDMKPQPQRGLARLDVPATNTSRLALVIGNANYKNVAPLRNPVNDANDMAEVLSNLGFEVILKRDVDKRTMVNAVQKFGTQLGSGGVGLFYFAGHGLQFQNRNFLVPIDANIKTEADIEFESLDVNRVLVQMEQANNENNFIILDACRDNPYARSFRGRGLVGRGLARMDSPRGSLIAYATAPGKVAEDGRGRNGTYTKHLLKFIQQPGLAVEIMFRKVRTDVVAETSGNQTPWESSSLQGEDFYFAGKISAEEQAEIKLLKKKLEEERQKRIEAEKRAGFGDKVFRDHLKDGHLGPEMVRIPSGSFRMGNVQGSGESDENPVHLVSVKPFAIGRYEVTFAEYDKFAEATGRKKPDDNGWGRNDRPVINVSWDDATAYTEWLSQQTDKHYRLPTEAEWEYAARAGTETSRYWGNNPNKACGYANVYDKSLGKKFDSHLGCTSRVVLEWFCLEETAWVNQGCTDGYVYTAPVGSFKPNTFELFDMLGNVREWTCSEYEDKYNGKEQRCFEKSFTNNESLLVLRGGSFFLSAKEVRFATRFKSSASNRFNTVGLRVVRVVP